MNILSIYQGHNSTVCFMRDGVIKYCVSEERLSRKKNDSSFPILSVNNCMRAHNLAIDNIDIVVFNAVPIRKTISVESTIIKMFEKALRRWALKAVYLLVKDAIVKLYWNHIRNKNKALFKRYFPEFQGQIIYPEHHLLHAYAGLYFSDFPIDAQEALIFVSDGEGDGVSNSVHKFSNGMITNIYKGRYSSSLGHFYESVTAYLGMKQMEHEYKVMGLSAYAMNTAKSKELFNKLAAIFYFKGLNFYSRIHSSVYPVYIKKVCQWHRFDNIAGSAQKVIEDVLIKWISAYITKFNIRNIILSGGVFMNVKANMEIAKLSHVKKVFIMPSCSDESIAIGGAIYACVNNGGVFKRHNDIYFGVELDDDAVKAALNKIDKSKYKITQSNDIELTIAQLLAKNEIVARCAGKMEWGARALGNRSILANASDPRNVTIINKMIKCRDFWMPFAPVILDVYARQYVKSPDIEKVNNDTMICAFESDEKNAMRDLYCAIHPYDKTMRPQILRENVNPDFYRILKLYHEFTGFGGVLNTSFNLHGQPLVCTPYDALDVFENCQLKYLALNDFLIQKL